MHRCSIGAIVVLALLSVSAWAIEPYWIADPKTGCKVWDASPAPNESIQWSGDCQNGLANGSGVLQWLKDGKPGSRYEGDYRNGRMNGHGVYTWTNGDRYDGEWRDDSLDGHGVKTWVNGDRYDGEWRDSKKSGYGVFTWPDSGRYEGEYSNDKPNGFGTLYKANSEKKYSGQWVNGCFHEGAETAWIGASERDCQFQ